MNEIQTEEQQLREEVESLCKSLRQVLEAEQVAIKERDSYELYNLVSQKGSLLNQIQENDSYLADLFLSEDESDSVEELKQNLQECRALNTKNRTLAALELKHTNKSIEHLRSLLNLDDLPLYAPSGQLTINREKRNLGVI